MLAWSWAAIWVAACVWEVVQTVLGGSLQGGREAHPSLSDLLDPFVATMIGQPVFVLCWIIGGVYLVRRGLRR
jgi:hypothetical protein